MAYSHVVPPWFSTNEDPPPSKYFLDLTEFKHALVRWYKDQNALMLDPSRHLRATSSRKPVALQWNSNASLLTANGVLRGIVNDSFPGQGEIAEPVPVLYTTSEEEPDSIQTSSEERQFIRQNKQFQARRRRPPEPKLNNATTNSS